MLIIDRFEGNWAIIEYDDRSTFNFPRDLLPANAREGDVITITTAIDQATTQQRHENAKRLLDNFFDK